MTDGHDRPTIRIGHSPDPDDAFMWWPLLEREGRPAPIDTGRFRFEIVAEDIEALNHRSDGATLEITALSCAQYPRVRDRYALTACGASMGDGYGPKLVARSPLSAEALTAPEAVVAVPGERTGAFGALSLLLGRNAFRYECVPFEEIIDAVAEGRFLAGLVIHEGQLTFGDAGLHLVEDLGAWWSRTRGLPLPLGVNAIRRDLENEHGPGTLEAVTGTLRVSLDHALGHRRESIEHALVFARDMGAERADEFIRLYVNRWTLDFGEQGRRAVEAFLAALHDIGVTPDAGAIEFIEPRSPADVGPGRRG